MASANPSGVTFWIGLNDIAVEGVYVWPTAEPALFFNWAQNQPDNSGNEDCGHMITPNGTWNDLPCTFALTEVVCEI
jgi:C-type mannose receptor